MTPSDSMMFSAERAGCGVSQRHLEHSGMGFFIADDARTHDGAKEPADAKLVDNPIEFGELRTRNLVIWCYAIEKTVTGIAPHEWTRDQRSVEIPPDGSLVVDHIGGCGWGSKASPAHDQRPSDYRLVTID
jgi:hypothetical protein